VHRRLQRVAVRSLSVSISAVAAVLIAGAGVAGAATRFRSGTRAHLLDSTRIATNGTASPGLHLTGPDVMASFVGLMAVLAFGFLVTTLIRRRIHSSDLASRAAA
jgi:hypothetical protein